MISTIDFKKRYPRQFKRLKEYYGGEKNIFDVNAAIQLYLRKEPPPTCEMCNIPLSICKKFRLPDAKKRCRDHINTKLVITLDALNKAQTDKYSIHSVPLKLLTRTDQIEICCKEHGVYKVNIGNFIDGMECQQCYFDSKIGISRGPHTEKSKKKISNSKIGKKINLSEEVKVKKTQKQKDSWKRRRENEEEFKKYLNLLSSRRKEHIAETGFVFPSKKDTKLEKKFEQFLVSKNIRYQKQYVLGSKKFDFFLDDMLLLVEVDGEYWHQLEQSIKNDIIKHKICVEHQIQLIRISSDNFCPEIIFESKAIQDAHTQQILFKRGINGLQ
jgi:very-short-patch-repair endonuclease